MAESKIDGDFYVTGRLRCGTASLPDDCVYDDQIAAAAAIEPTKLVRNRFSVSLPGFKSTDAAADGIYTIHTFTKAGKVIGFSAGCATDPVGDDIVEFDLLGNASSGAAMGSILDSDAEVPIISTTGDRVAVAGTIDAAEVTRAVGTILQIEVDAQHNTGTLGVGPFATVIIEEEP